MFDNIIFGIKATILLVSLFMVGYYLWDRHFWAAGAMFVTLMALAYLMTTGMDADGELVPTLGSVIALLTAVHIFTTSDATNMELQGANWDLFNELLTINYCPNNHQPDESKRTAFKELKDIAYMKCGMQTHADLLSMSFDLTKAVHLPIELGFTDTIYNELFDDTKRVKCIDLARAADKLCPNLLRTKLPN